jgi:hypothetical protein
MSEQAVVAHADADARGEPPEKCGDEKGFPGEEKQRDDGADMEERHERSSDPIDFVLGCLLLF